MPAYTLKNIKDNIEFDVTCTYEELQVMLDERPDVGKVLKAPKIVSGIGSLINRTDDGWNERLGQIKAGSGKNNTIRTK